MSDHGPDKFAHWNINDASSHGGAVPNFLGIFDQGHVATLIVDQAVNFTAIVVHPPTHGNP